MKVASCLLMALLLVACSTPRPIVDTATIVTRMTNDMDSSVSNYVSSLKTVRQSDATRLQELRLFGEEDELFVREQAQILALANETGTLKVLNTLALASDPDPLRAAPVAANAASPGITFDGAPLKAVAKITADIAQPRSAGEQLLVLVTFAKTVNEDLAKAAKANSKPE